jgi:hypothetical protein
MVVIAGRMGAEKNALKERMSMMARLDMAKRSSSS